MEYIEAEYQQFIRYVKSTWGQLVEEWTNEPEIDKVFVSLNNRKFDVAVFFKENSYPVYDWENKELLLKEYNGEPITTSYSLDSDIILEMILRKNVIEDLGLSNVKVLNMDYSFTGHDELTKELERIEGDWAEAYYCMIHDL